MFDTEQHSQADPLIKELKFPKINFLLSINLWTVNTFWLSCSFEIFRDTLVDSTQLNVYQISKDHFGTSIVLCAPSQNG